MSGCFYLQNALEATGMSSDEMLNVFKIVAITLKLGNLIFTPATNIDGTGGCEVNNDYGDFRVPVHSSRAFLTAFSLQNYWK